MSDLERRLREARPPVSDPAPGSEERILRAVESSLTRRGPSPRSWARGLSRGRGGRLLGVALLILIGASAVALATGIIPRGPDRGSQASAAAPPAQWGEATTLAEGIARLPHPQVAMDEAGNATVAWARDGRIEVAHRPAGERWEPIRRLSPAGVPVGDPALASLQDGDVLVVWRERRDARTERRVLRFPDGSVAGTIERRIGGRYVLVGRRRDPDGDWTPALELSPAGANQRDMASPRVAAAGDRFLVAWTRGDRLETRYLAGDGSLSDIETIDPAGDGEPLAPWLAANRSGAAVLAWTVRSRTTDAAGFALPEFRVEAARRTDDGWTDAADLGGPSLNNPYPVAALSRDGLAVIAWVRASGDPSEITAARASAGSDWREPQRLSAPGRSAFSPSLAIDGDGRIVAHWATGASTQVALADGLGPWRPPAGLGGSGLAAQYAEPLPVLAADGAGRLVGAFGVRGGGIAVRDWPRGGPFGPARGIVSDTGWQHGAGGLAASRTGATALVVVGFGRSERPRRPWSVRVILREPGGARAGSVP